MSRVRNSHVVAAIAAVALAQGLGAGLWAGTASAPLAITANVQAKAVIISVDSPSVDDYTLAAPNQGDAKFDAKSFVKIRGPKGLLYRARFVTERSVTKGGFRLASLRAGPMPTSGNPSSAAILTALGASDISGVAVMIEW